MKRTAQALTLGMLLLVLPAFAQEKPKADTTPASTAQVTTVQTPAPAPQVTTPAPQPTPAPVKDANHWKRPLGEIKFREF